MAKEKKEHRDDFSSTVIKHLGNRVNHICSNPGCQIVTVGPKATPDKAAVIGKAAHITAAAEGGPRYDPTLSTAQRKGIDNGIWLCANCHDMVDADPVRYPAELLRQWKQQAEAAASGRIGKPITAAQEPHVFPLEAEAIPLDAFVPGSRDTELATLRASLEREGVVYLWGFGGMGKTETAICLARGMAPAGGVYLLHYQNSMRETILKLNFKGYKFYAPPSINTPEAFAEADLRKRMEMLRQCCRDAIVIVDNFDVEGKTLAQLQSEPACRELLSSGFRLIFTTRSPIGRPDWEIGPLTPEYRLKLMRDLAPELDATDEQLTELIDAVSGHTLTLVLMARTLSESWGDVTPAQMLTALKSSRWEELESPDVASGKDRDHTQRRIEAHLAALFDLSDLSEAAKTVLACATLLPEDGLSASLFRKCLPPEQKEALVSLAGRNWLTRREGLLTIHPVMRQVCRMALKPGDAACGPFLEALWGEYDEKAYDAEKYRRMGACFAAASDTLGSRNPWYPNHAGRLFSYVGLNDLGLEFFRRAVELVERYDPENGEMLGTVWNDVSYSYSALGNAQKALEYYEKAFRIRLTSLGPDHPDVVLSYANVGAEYSHLGDHKKALELSQTALDIRRRILPQDHPDLARSYHSVGAEYSYLGDHKKALELVQTALDIRRRILPKDHPDLAHSYDAVGAEYSNLGDHKKALELKQTALDIRKRILPQDHPDLAFSYDSVGIEYSHLGDHKKALELSQTALDIRRRILPQDHPDLARSYHSVGAEYSHLGDHKKALELVQTALDIRKRILPQDHPDLAHSYHSVGTAYSYLGDHKKALELIQTALDIRKRILPQDHPDLAHSYDSVGTTYSHLGVHKKALELKQTALDIRKRVLLQDHPDLADSCRSVAVSLWNLRRLPEVLPLLQEALEIRRHSLPAGHPALTQICNDLSDFHSFTKNRAKALYFRRLAAENDAKRPK